MQRARVLGYAVATAKHPSMQGKRLILMQPLGPQDCPDGDPVLVVDTLGAGVGATAIISSDGRWARELMGTNQTPVRYTVLGLQDD